MLTEFAGIDLSGLSHATALQVPDVVPGRVAHIDADFLAYQVSAEKADGSDKKSLEDMQHNAEEAVQHLKSLAAAEHVHLHLTPSTSTKGQRAQLAQLKEYQGNRKDQEKPQYLHVIRDWLVDRFPGTLHQNCEADDGMATAQYRAIAEGRRGKSIIVSKDKDLNMVPGLHLVWDTGEIVDTDDFGWIELVEGSTKKIVGYGAKFFWAQMLMGDPVDNVSGLPKVPGKVMNKIRPTTLISKALAVLDDPNSSPEKRAKAQRTLDERPACACGPVTAYDLLGGLTNNEQCFAVVKALYKTYGETIGFRHWQTGEDVAWNKAFVSEAQLLWMRRNAGDPNCVVRWWSEVLT
ncbi:hypothetical protein [Pannonibacter sp. SL95]|uniref:hypothetical protein n=1 Tax=Pannonibacter sp. SL95 TaxID=2995153 RepID=UPI00227290A5|nr:hypothetical protein [Pannonibacter sp. SL95]MCY1708370.1 hypothetical protein [Pannonibacter sp. SL95]